MAKQPTQAEAIIAAFKARGYVEVDSPTGKARAFKPRLASTKTLFVGKAGSLRWGRVFSQSRPVPTRTKAELIADGRKITS